MVVRLSENIRQPDNFKNRKILWTRRKNEEELLADCYQNLKNISGSVLLDIKYSILISETDERDAMIKNCMNRRILL